MMDKVLDLLQRAGHSFMLPFEFFVSRFEGNDMDSVSRLITKGLGGRQNISGVDCCVTRLRCAVYKPQLVQEALLRRSGASGVINKGAGVQVVYGSKVTAIKSNLEDYLASLPEEERGAEGCGEAPLTLFSPAAGELSALAQVPDCAFAAGMAGEGYMISPSEGIVTAPEDGEVTMVFDTGHAVGLKNSCGVECMIHVGVDTVELDGEGFEVPVSVGDQVKQGDILLRFDRDYIRANAVSDAVIVVFPGLEKEQSMQLSRTGRVERLERIGYIL